MSCWKFRPFNGRSLICFGLISVLCSPEVEFTSDWLLACTSTVEETEPILSAKSTVS